MKKRIVVYREELDGIMAVLECKLHDAHNNYPSGQARYRAEIQHYKEAVEQIDEAIANAEVL